jgi:PAS domain S-box-containing protein
MRGLAMKVLIVEDNADSRNLLAKQLSAYGHEVTAAVDGVDALEKARKSPPDILVSDILMPRMDGYKLCYEWKQHKQLKDIPFVFYTAIYTSGEDEKFALNLGANLFIRKPIEPEALAKILSQAFEQAKEGLLPPAKAPPKPSLYLTEYNERLVAKLNEKVAELEKSEGELRYLSSVLGAIRNINQLIVRERDKTKLLKGACQILHNVREYRFVWVGLIEAGHKRVIPVARAGVEDKYLDEAEITWDDSQSGQSPAGVAIKTKKPDLIRNIPKNPRSEAWREKARKQGYRSSAAIPIIHNEKVYGALSVYSSQPDGFNEAEVGLLVEVSSDLAFALNAIERQEARQRAEEALLESEEKYKTLTEDVPVGIYFNDFRGTFLYGNKKAEEITGYKREELLGKSFLKLKLLGAKELGRAAKLLALNKLGKATGPDRFVLNRKDGTKSFVEIRTRVTTVGGKKLVLGMVEDITERMRAEEALRENEAFQSGLLSNSPVPISVINADSSIRYVNPALEKLTGFSAEELIGEKAPHPFWLEENQAKTMKGFKKAMRHGGKGVVEPFQKKNGEKLWVEITSTPVKKDGKFQYLLVSWVNITERRQAEEALRESEAFQSGLLSNSPVPISVVNPDGSLRYVSPALEKLTGFSAEELLWRKPPYPYWPKERQKEIMKHLNKAMRQRGKAIVELFQKKNGEEFWVEITSTPVKEDGKFRYLLANWVDITERKQAEEEIARLARFPSENPAPVMRVDRDGTILYANKAALPLLNEWKCQVGQLLPKYWREFTLNVLNSGSRKNVEVNVGKRIFTVNFFPVTGEGYVNIYGLDITERKHAEEALRESEARYRAVIEGAYDMIQSVGLDGSIIFVNKAWRDTLGYTEADLASLNLSDIIHPESQEHCREMMAEVVKGKPAQNIEATFLTKDGRKILVEGSAAPRYIGNRVVATQGIFRDVTERKQAEERLRDEATRRRILIDQSSDGIVILDQNGKVYEANQRFADMLGYTYEEAQELSVWDWEFQFPREQVAEMIRTVDETGDHFETRHRRKDGTIYDVEISTNGAIYAGQKLIFCVCRDITERKQAEAALRQSEEKLRVILESIPQGVTVTDLDGKILQVNNAVLRLHGCSTRQELVGRNAFELITKGGRARATDSLKNTLETGHSGAIEYTLIRKDGTTFPAQLSAALVQDESAKPIGFVAVTEDITERKQAEAALRESEEKYKNLVGATSDIIWETDAEGWFTFISPKVKDILGYEVDEVVGKQRTLDLVPKGQFRKWLEYFKEINAKHGSFFSLEIPHLHKNGRQVIIETSGIPLFDSAGKFKGYVGANRDITERRQMQEQLVITDRLASVGELAAGIAHELNNPLTGVIGFSQLLMDKEMPDDIKQDIKVVYGEAQRASQVVKNLLTFARKHAAAKEQVNINDIINKVLELRAYEQNLENISVDARLDPKLPEVMVDYFQLQQVFLNIIINAEYFMKEAHHGGKLTITTEKVDNKVRTSFADDGPGIAKENLGHLFDPFFTTKEVGKGTGLGLSICHGIVAEHGGRIYVESEPGKGANFIVELPIGTAERKGGAA